MSISHLYPSISPSLSLNFARSKTLDPRITFTRTTAGTRINETGLVEVVPANSPRFDHSYDPVSGTVKSLGLLIEEQSENSLRYSNDFSQSNWAKQNSHPVPTQDVVGPDGVSNSGWRFYRTATNQYIHQQVVGGGTHTLSAWIRSEEATGDFVMQGWNATDGTMATSFTATNQWKRFSITISPTTNTNYYPCTPTNINKNFYVYGAQLELNKSFLTSYIPTSGSTATRTVDVVSMTGTNFSSWFNQTEGTLFADFMGKTIRSSLTFDRYIAIVGNDPNLDEMGFYTQTADGGGIYKKIAGFITNNTVGQISGVVSGGGPDFGGKAILAYKSNDASYTINGVTPVTDNTVELPTFVGLRIFGRARYQPEPSGHISQLIYYPKRLTDTQLINLTK